MNPEKHVKNASKEMTLADSSEVPTRARSAHVVGQYIKDRKVHYERGRTVKTSPVLFRLADLPDNQATRKRVELLVREINRECRLAHAPLRVRLV